MTGTKRDPISPTTFLDPILFGVLELSNGEAGVAVELRKIKKFVIKNMGLEDKDFGVQIHTGTPLLDVWIIAAVMRLKDTGFLAGHLGGPTGPAATTVAVSVLTEPLQRCALTEKGLQRANEIIGENLMPVEEPPENRETQEPETEKGQQPKGILILGIRVPVNADIPQEACLPLPEAYQLPRIGKAASQAKDTMIALLNRRSTYIWGLPGSGKDAFVHAYSAMTKTPAQIFTVSPNEDIQSWFFLRSFEREGTSWEEGEFLKAARDGYTAPDGKKHPYLILISDLDRATKNQAEALRLVMDSIQGRIMGPLGVKYPVFPGTQIVATANSNGAGDTRGRCISSNVMDASILDRFERKFHFDTLEWSDEEAVLKRKFQALHKIMPGVWKPVGDSVRALRDGVEQGQVFAEFGHRAVCSWVGHIQDIILAEYENPQKITEKKAIGGLLRRGATVLLDSLPDADTQLQVKRLMEPSIPGGWGND